MDEALIRFGERDELFGVFHARSQDGVDVAVVFCAPFAEEQKCAYRTFVEAARAFAEAGVACLRFDYLGTGDSDGGFEDFSPPRAIDNIAAAAHEVRKRAGLSRVILLGLRLGGTMALAAAPRAEADEVILWQPVVSGKSFFDLTIKRQMFRRQLMASNSIGERCPPVRTGGHLPDAPVIDLDGFPLSRSAADEIRSLDCLEAAKQFTGPVRLLQISHTEKMAREHRQLADMLGDRLTFAAVTCPPFWNRIDRIDTSAVAQTTLDWLR